MMCGGNLPLLGTTSRNCKGRLQMQKGRQAGLFPSLRNYCPCLAPPPHLQYLLLVSIATKELPGFFRTKEKSGAFGPSFSVARVCVCPCPPSVILVFPTLLFTQLNCELLLLARPCCTLYRPNPSPQKELQSGSTRVTKGKATTAIVEPFACTTTIYLVSKKEPKQNFEILRPCLLLSSPALPLCDLTRG